MGIHAGTESLGKFEGPGTINPKRPVGTVLLGLIPSG